MQEAKQSGLTPSPPKERGAGSGPLEEHQGQAAASPLMESLGLQEVCDNSEGVLSTPPLPN